MLWETTVRVPNLKKSELDSTFAEILVQLFQLALTGGLNLEDALLVPGILESICEGGLDVKQSPVCIG